jgi:hypothetical protein
MSEHLGPADPDVLRSLLKVPRLMRFDADAACGAA